MAPIAIPRAGLPLSEFPTEMNLKKNRIRQAIEAVSMGDETMDQIIQKMQKNAVEVVVSLGKKPALVIDKKPYPLQTLYQPQSLLFKKSDDSKELQLIASLNLKDALARAKVATSVDIDFNDPAIMALQQSMAQAKEQKDANKAIFVKDSSKLPPAKGGRAALSSMLKAHRVGMFGASSTTRSLPTSPSLGGVTPQPSQNDAKSIKQRALKTSLIHLLAVRAVSEKYIVGALGCSPTDIKPLLEKYGRESPFDKTKFNLSDKGYKELDVWNFPYKDESDRQGAIDRAVTAFDRQRISVADQLWQSLLKKEERGKGVSLSRLKNLHDGPVERVRTPRIQVEATSEEGANSGDKQSEEGRARLAPGDAQVRSRSQDPPTKKKVSEREAQSKRLFAKDPKKAADKAAEMAKTRATAPAKAEKKSTEEKKTTPKKVTGKSSVNNSSKVKSAEFVHDSDEEIESDELAAQSSQPIKRKAQKDISPPSKKVQPVPKVAPKPVAAPKPAVKKPEPKKIAPQPPVAPKPEKQKKPASTVEPKESRPNGSQHVTSTKRIPESKRPVPMARSLSHKRSGSSPVKPSPLGSSPPTNASDLDTEVVHKAASSKSSSSSGSPLINQRRERLEAEAKKNAVRPAASSAGIVQKTATSPEGRSDRILKRVANDTDGDLHSHGKPKPIPYNNVSYSSSQDHLPKRPRLSSSPLSDPTSSDRDSVPRSDHSSSSDTSPSMLSPQDLEYARSFKLQLAKYNFQLREVQALHAKQQAVSQDKIDKLHRMHSKLAAHKQEIWRMGGGR